MAKLTRSRLGIGERVDTRRSVIRTRWAITSAAVGWGLNTAAPHCHLEPPEGNFLEILLKPEAFRVSQKRISARSSMQHCWNLLRRDFHTDVNRGVTERRALREWIVFTQA